MLNITECSVGAIIKLSAYQPLTITSTSNTACPTSSIVCRYLGSTVECNGLMIFPDDSLDVHVTSLNSDCSVCSRHGLRISATLSATFTSGERFDITLNLRDSSTDPSQYLHTAHILPAYTMQYNSFEFCATGIEYEPHCATDKSVTANSVAGNTFDVAIKQVFPFHDSMDSTLLVLDDGTRSKGISYNCGGWSTTQLKLYDPSPGACTGFANKQNGLIEVPSGSDKAIVDVYEYCEAFACELIHTIRVYTSPNFYSPGGPIFRWTAKQGGGEASKTPLLMGPARKSLAYGTTDIGCSFTGTIATVESVFVKAIKISLHSEIINFIHARVRSVSPKLKKEFITVYALWEKSFSMQGSSDLFRCSNLNECIALIALGSETIPLYMYKFLKNDMNALYPYELLILNTSNANLLVQDIQDLNTKVFKLIELWFEYENNLKHSIPHSKNIRFLNDRSCRLSDKYAVGFSLYDKVPCNFNVRLFEGSFVTPLLALAHDVEKQSQICYLSFNATTNYKLGIAYTSIITESQNVRNCSKPNIIDYSNSGFASKGFASVFNSTHVQIKIISFNTSALAIPASNSAWCASFSLPIQASSKFVNLEQEMLSNVNLALGGTYYFLEAKNNSEMPVVVYKNESGLFFMSKHDTEYHLERISDVCNNDMCKNQICISGEVSPLLDILAR